MKKLEGKAAVVTGASKGIGASIAKHFGSEGSSVVVNYVNDSDGAGRVVAEIEDAGGKAIAVQGDVSNAADAKRIIDAAIENYGGLDILVNNSGVYEFAPLEEITEDQFHKMFNVNVLGPLLVTQAALRYLGQGSSVINIGSAVTRLTPPNSSIYSGTKGALDAITGVLARELGAKKIRVNSINPGPVVTEGVETAGFLDSEFLNAFVEQTPLGRIGQPGDIASLAVFLASNDSAWLTGELLTTSGGLR